MKLQAAGVTRISESGATEAIRKGIIDRSMSHASIPLLQSIERFDSRIHTTTPRQVKLKPILKVPQTIGPANYRSSFECIVYFG